jgi:hypothetical protein
MPERLAQLTDRGGPGAIPAQLVFNRTSTSPGENRRMADSILDRAPRYEDRLVLDIEQFLAFCEFADIDHAEFLDGDILAAHQWLEEGDPDSNEPDGLPDELIPALAAYDVFLVKKGHRRKRAPWIN